MPKNDKPENGVDWDLTSWEGSRREQLRRWAQLPLERIIAALEEMQEMSETLATSGAKTGAAVKDQPGDYASKAGKNDIQDNRSDDGE